MNILSSLETSRALNPNKVAFRFIQGEHIVETITYRELYDKSQLIAHNLLELGAKKNDRLLIILPQSSDYLLVFVAGLLSNLILIPMFPPRKTIELKNLISIIEDASVSYVVGTGQELQELKQTIEDNNLDVSLNFVNIDSIISTPLNSFKSLPVLKDLSQITFLQYTSGSTGVPKGVMINHNNLIANFIMMQEGMQLVENSKIISWLPFYHDMGLIGSVLLSLYSNAEVTLMTPFQFIKRPLSWLEAITKYQGTHSYAPNFAYDLCIKAYSNCRILNLDLSSWIVALNGAEPIRTSTVKDFIEIFKKHGFNPKSYYPAYGMAEATLYITGNYVSTGCKYKTLDQESLENFIITNAIPGKKSVEVVSCGKTRCDLKVLIVDPSSFEEKCSNEIGEIWLIGPNVSQGYWNKEEINKLIFKAYTRNTKQGPCFRTGDLGYLDEDNDLYIISRIKDIIIINGKNYAPQDIEMTVEQATGLRLSSFAAAFSVDVNGKEELIVVIEIKGLSQEEKKVVEQRVKRNLSYELNLTPYDIFFTPRGGIPKTTSGKLKRSSCKVMYQARKLPTYSN
jgi:acyl-CoA synthetase (AMP-forming)/AMP-acid ligase II